MNAPIRRRPGWQLAAAVCLWLTLAGSAAAAGCHRIALVLDPRLTPEAVAQAWRSGEPRPEAPAVLELRDCAGALLDRRALEAPLARLDPSPLPGAAAASYLVSVDLTAPIGSYSGPLTHVIRVSNHRMRDAVARAADGRLEPIRLAQTGKAGWRRVSMGGAEQLLAINCQPSKDGFTITYRRYWPTRHGWQVRTRSEPGLWESDAEFPSTDRFVSSTP